MVYLCVRNQKNTHKMTHKEISEIILQQLGGNKFLALTGCKNLAFDPSSVNPYLSMQLPASNKAKAKWLKIELMPSDTYTMTFIKKTKNGIEEVAKHEGVYCDMLCFMFTKVTGWFTSL